METNNSIPEFGTKRENEERRDGGIGIVFDPKSQKYAVGKQLDGMFRLFSGGVDASEDIQIGTLREVSEESGLSDFSYVENIGSAFCHYYNSLRKVNRVTHATCFLIILNNATPNETKLEAHETFSLYWTTAAEMVANWDERNGEHDLDHWMYFIKKAVTRAKELGYDTTSPDL